MATHRMPPIQPLHPVGTVCTHRVKPSGKPLEEGCAGRSQYRATCSCGWQDTGAPKGSVAYGRSLHADAMRRGKAGA